MCPICWHWKPVAEQQQFANQNILNIFERKKKRKYQRNKPSFCFSADLYHIHIANKRRTQTIPPPNSRNQKTINQKPKTKMWNSNSPTQIDMFWPIHVEYMKFIYLMTGDYKP